MSRQTYKVRDGDGVVVGQYYRSSEPPKPDGWGGEWNVEAVDKDDLNTEPVEWWDEQ